MDKQQFASRSLRARAPRSAHSVRKRTIRVVATMPAVAETARGFVDALGRRDYLGVREHLHDDVGLRVMLPRHVVERTGAPAVVMAFCSWLETAQDFEIVSLSHHSASDGAYVSSRFLLRPDWAPDQWHLIEQVGFIRVRDGRINHIDLLCSGFLPVHRETNEPSVPRMKEGQR